MSSKSKSSLEKEKPNQLELEDKSEEEKRREEKRREEKIKFIKGDVPQNEKDKNKNGSSHITNISGKDNEESIVNGKIYYKSKGKIFIGIIYIYIY